MAHTFVSKASDIDQAGDSTINHTPGSAGTVAVVNVIMKETSAGSMVVTIDSVPMTEYDYTISGGHILRTYYMLDAFDGSEFTLLVTNPLARDIDVHLVVFDAGTGNTSELHSDELYSAVDSNGHTMSFLQNAVGDVKVLGMCSGEGNPTSCVLTWTGSVELYGADKGQWLNGSDYLICGASEAHASYTSSNDDLILHGLCFKSVSSSGPVYGTATSNSSASTVGKGKRNTQGTATSNSSASTVGVGSKTTYGTATATASASTVGVGSKLLMGKATATASANTIGIGRTLITETATATASSDTAATSSVSRPGSATSNASASTVVKGGNAVTGTATANTSASTIGVGRRSVVGTATANAGATTIADGNTSSSSSATLTCGATTIAIGSKTTYGTATANTSATTDGVGKRILQESATALTSAFAEAIGKRILQESATALASALTEATGDTIGGNKATLTCGATTVAVGKKVKLGTATSNASATVSGIANIYILGIATANAGANTSAIGVTLGLEDGIVSGCLIAMITNGIFICKEVEYNRPPLEPGATLQASPAILLREYITGVITLLQLPLGATDWPAYIGTLPDGSTIEDDAASLYDTTPLKDGRTHRGATFVHYGVQLKIRSKEYADGWSKITEISSQLDALIDYLLEYDGESYVIQNVSQASPPVLIGNEPSTKRRFMFTANFLCTIRQVA